MPDKMPVRALPLLDKDNTPFWTGGRNGDLLIHRCGDCSYYVHPPVRFCPNCESRNVEPQAVSGRGVVETFTVVRKEWVPGLKVPYVLALVTIDEQADVRLAANIEQCEPEDVRFGMPVEVFFENRDDIWVPLFRPARIGEHAA